MAKQKILLIDGSNLIFRAYFAFQRSGLTTADGRPSGAVFGFLRLFVDALQKELPDEVYVAWDPKGGTFRDKEFEYYKANRPDEMPEDLFEQLMEVHKILDYLGIKNKAIKGIEADDIIGTLSQKAVDNGWTVKVFSGDRDLFQLVNKSVKVLYPSRKGGLDLFGEKEVEIKMGVKPSQIIDYKGLSGDASDNIKGVPGVGEKTAQKLLRQFKTFEDIFKNVDEVTPAGLQQKLKDNEQLARDSYYLATVKTDCDVDIDWAKPRPFAINNDKVQEFVEEYGLKSLRKALPELLKNYGEKIEFAPSQEVSNTATTKKVEEFTASTAELTKVLKNLPRLAVSVGEINTIGFEFEGKDLYKVVDDIPALLADYSGEVFVWDSKKLIKDIGFEANYVDIMLGLYVWDSSWKQDIDFLVHDIGYGDHGSEQDALKMLWVGDYLMSQLDSTRQNLWLRLENPVAQILARMELEGVYIDKVRLQKLNKKLEAKKAEFTKSIYAKIGREDFNINSTQQLSAALAEAGYKLGKKNKNGGYSTSVKILEKLVDSDERGLIQDILDYRTVTKLHSSFTDTFLEMLDKDSRLHTEYVQNKVPSGRLSSVNPNLQNIPIRNPEYGPLIRSCFAAPKGKKIVSADYSQIELRVLAHVSGDPVLVEAFTEDQDIHARTASEIFEIPLDEVGSKERGLGKTLNFALVYQQGVFSTAKQLGISVAEAKEFIEKYFDRFKNIKPLVDKIIAGAYENEFVETVFGRRVYFKNINSSMGMVKAANERIAFNAVLQGTGTGDITKFAMIRIDREIKKQGLDMKMLLQVHDELVFEVADKDVEQAKKIIVEQMELDQPLKVPLKVDIGVGDNWAESK